MSAAEWPSGISNSPNVNFKTGTLQQSESFIWNTADILGKGATALVYYGRHKISGDVVAVKVFHDSGLRHLDVARRREVESLSLLSHKNIVKFLGLEREFLTGQEVLVTEFCSGGSLYTCLEQPQNLYGFTESEFLIFLKDIAEGMSYIRQKGFIHRDIKPGNIMRFIGEDGRSTFKLTDFGAARELHEDETYMSIYGTEEYLHPGMFERAVLRGGTVQSFDATVDLWSLGVTIYHVATGQLPFQPYGGRQDPVTMHAIISKKPVGVISGIQLEENGQIIWSKKLPTTCQLPETLQDLLVPMLAGVMEINPHHKWNFDKFFKTGEDINNRVKINVFYCCSAENLMLYMKPTDTYANIVEVLAGITENAASNQLVLSSDRELSELVDPTLEIRKYPKSLLQTQIYLFPKEVQDDVRHRIIDIPAFSEFSSEMDLEKDAKISRKCAAIAYYICTAISRVLQHQNLMATAENNLRHVMSLYKVWKNYGERKCFPGISIKRVVWHCEKNLPFISSAIVQVRKRQEAVRWAFGYIVPFAKVHFGQGNMKTEFSDAHNCLKTIERLMEDPSCQEFLEKIEKRMKEIENYIQVLISKLMEQEQKSITMSSKCSEEDYCLSKAENLKQKVIGVMTIMMKHRKYGDLHSHEKFIHQCESQKLEVYFTSLVSVLHGHCMENLKLCYREGMKNIWVLCKHFKRTKKIELNITSVIDSIQQLSSQLEKMEEECKRRMDIVLDAVKGINTQTSAAQVQAISAAQNLQIEASKKGPLDPFNVERSEKLKQLNSSLQFLSSESLVMKGLVKKSTVMLQELGDGLKGDIPSASQQKDYQQDKTKT